MNTRKPFNTFCFSLVICKNSLGKYLGIKETKGRGWWIPGGHVEPDEDFFQAAKRETSEEAGIEVEITGVLRVEHSISNKSNARMRVIFFAVPKHEDLCLKNKPDEHSEGATWLSMEEISSMRNKGLLRGDELYYWPKYIEHGGMISPISFFTNEDEIVNNLTLEDVVKSSRKSSLGKYCSEEIKILSPEEEFTKYLNENNPAKLRKLLSAETIDINAPINERNWSPLIVSIKNKYEEIVSILLMMNSNLNNLTHKKRNCLHFATQSSLKIFNSVLISILSSDRESQIRILNQQDIYGDTPLHIAARDTVNDVTNQNSEIIYNLLTSHGASPNISNNVGLSPAIILEKKIK
jgi:8-oxo-dGTP pyrophosphatase MutT (NUDIX family)